MSWLRMLVLMVSLALIPKLATGGDTLVYYQSSGEFFAKGSPVVTPLAKGYSGAGEHRDNPKSQCVGDLGPIPVGVYSIGPLADLKLPDGRVIGSMITLTPAKGNDMCDRTGFLIHGDNITYPGWASGGCIILEKRMREKISNAGFKKLEVVKGE